MSERVKFDDESTARGKIATSPEITVTKSEVQQVAQPVKEHVATGSQPVQALEDDPAADERFSRMMGRLAKRAGKIDDDFAAEITDWGKDFIFPTLRDLFRAKPGAFRAAVAGAISLPAIFFSIKAGMKAAKQDQQKEGSNAGEP